MQTLILMRGVPGSGKSYIAMRLGGRVCSADEYWYREQAYTPVRVYRFDAKRLPDAHAWNQKQVEEALQDSVSQVVVDNCNLERWHVEPYLALAKKYGAKVQVVEVHTELEVCLRRNAERSEDRRVPEETIRRGFEKMKERIS